MNSLSKLLRAALFAAAIGTTAAASAVVTGPNYSDMWSNAQEPGWGLTIDHQGTALLGTLFIYNKFGLATWYTVVMRQDSVGPNNVVTYSGVLNETTGPAVGQPFDPALVVYREVGRLTHRVRRCGARAHDVLGRRCPPRSSRSAA